MAGWGDIGGGCTVKFTVDHIRKGDKLQRWSAYDGAAARRGRKNLTITFPRGVRRQVRGNRVTLTLRGRKKKIRIRWN